MLEFKVTDDIDLDIGNVNQSGNALNAEFANFPVDNLTTLKTAVKFHNQNNNIKILLDLYKELVIKDAKDISDMVKEARKMDEILAGTMKY